jgi:hypothetical protein
MAGRSSNTTTAVAVDAHIAHPLETIEVMGFVGLGFPLNTLRIKGRG